MGGHGRKKQGKPQAPVPPPQPEYAVGAQPTANGKGEASTAQEDRLKELEQAMGVLNVENSEENSEFSGQIDPDEPEDRQAVQYGTSDALFDDDAPAPALGGSGDTAALISYLEGVAGQLEAASGEQDPEIRQKIRLLNSVLDGRPAAPEQTAAAPASAEPLEADVEAVEGDLGDVMKQVEALAAEMGSIETLLQQDDDAAALLAQSSPLWMPAIAPDGGK